MKRDLDRWARRQFDPAKRGKPWPLWLQIIVFGGLALVIVGKLLNWF